MNFLRLKSLTLLAFGSLLLTGCGSTLLVSTPVDNIDAVPLKVSDLTEDEKKNWGHLDLIADTIPGMSVNKAYDEIIGNKKGKTVIVAVVDSGMDLDHEDLDDVLWTNKREKPGNNIDDDRNGYVDDIHGYNFLGSSYNEQLELSRILNRGPTRDRRSRTVPIALPSRPAPPRQEAASAVDRTRFAGPMWPRRYGADACRRRRPQRIFPVRRSSCP